jgi:OFA family oxalate/formate antiporter-like MFS transporter
MAVCSLAVCYVAALRSHLLPQTLLMIWCVQFFFGCGFSCMPNILHQHYGLNQLSTVQGLTLSAWAIAGLVGNQFALFMINNYSLSALYTCLGIIYTAELALIFVWAKVAAKKDSARAV